MKDLFDGWLFCICIAIYVLLVADCKCQIVLFIIALLWSRSRSPGSTSLVDPGGI